MMRRLLALVVTLGAVGACGGRDAFWDEAADTPLTSVGLTGSVALADPALDRVLMLTSPSGRELRAAPIRVGHNLVKLLASPDRGTLFALSAGAEPRRSKDDELPSLTVIDGGTRPEVRARYELTDPLRGLGIDPEGEWAVVYEAEGSVVVNPNELILIDLVHPDAAPITKTIRSFGGRPQRISFTSPLTLPKGPPRRLLVVETDHDVTLIDLSHPERDEVTVMLPRTPSGAAGSPAEIAWSDGEPGSATDARIAVRLKNDPNVLVLELGPAPASEPDKDYRPTINIADVGGVPSAIDFVETDGGLRLAALVPTQVSAMLVDPATTMVQRVDLGRPYSRLTRVTGDIKDKPVKSDVALLWSEQTRGIAFWSLGVTTGTPYRSVDAYDIGISVASVLDVPGTAFSNLKLLKSAGEAEFYVLDLDRRMSFPMLTTARGFDLTVAPDGGRAWATLAGGPLFAEIDLKTLHPTSLTLERDLSAVYDIARADGGRSAVAMHQASSGNGWWYAATVLDALRPDTADTAFYSALILGGQP